MLTGAATGLGAIALTVLLEIVQRAVWGGSGTNILDSARLAPASSHVLILLGAGAAIGLGQYILKTLTSANGIDTSAAIWFHAGRLPALRTLGSAVLSVIVVGMGASLGREGAPKQAAAVFANLFADKLRLSDEQWRLVVACGAGAGMSAAYGVPVGGALFSLEVMRGALALRYVLPALVTSVIATGCGVARIARPPHVFRRGLSELRISNGMGAAGTRIGPCLSSGFVYATGAHSKAPVPPGDLHVHVPGISGENRARHVLPPSQNAGTVVRKPSQATWTWASG